MPSMMPQATVAPSAAHMSSRMKSAVSSLLETKTTVPLATSLVVFSVTGLVVAVIAKKSFSFDMVLTFVVLSLLVALSIALSKLTRHKVPAIVTAMTLGALATTPISPFAGWLTHIAESVPFLSIITGMLTSAGLGIGKDLPLLRGIGWRIIPTGIVAIVLLSLSTVIGIASPALRSPTRRLVAISTHSAAAATGLVLLVGHIVLAIVDSYIHISPLAVVIPGASSWEPLRIGIGTIAFDLLLLLLVTTLTRLRAARAQTPFQAV